MARRKENFYRPTFSSQIETNTTFTSQGHSEEKQQENSSAQM